MRKTALVILTLTLVMACASLDCPVNNIVATRYSLQKPDGTPDTMGVDTLWIWTKSTDGTDVMLVNRLCGTKATYFSIEPSLTLPVDMVCLEVEDTIGTVWDDTIWVTKEDYPHFEGVDCKASYFHTITGVRSTRRIIDTVIINKNTVDYDASTAHFLLRLKARR